MKKDLIFAPALLAVFVLLALLSVTGLTGHIVISVIGIVLLAAYTATTKKDWKIPALEIIMRVCYGIAIITGVVIMKAHGLAAAGIAHKVSATVFAVLLVVLFVTKLRAGKKA